MVIAVDMGMDSGLALEPGRITVKNVIAARAIMRYMIMLRFQLIFMGKLLSVSPISITHSVLQNGQTARTAPCFICTLEMIVCRVCYLNIH